MIPTIYLIYAFVQAILVCRFFLKMKDGESPVWAVSIFTLLAPMVSGVIILSTLASTINYLVTGKWKW